MMGIVLALYRIRLIEQPFFIKKTNMKITFLLIIFSSLLLPLTAQNPYFDLSYPWLSNDYIKNNKIESIVLGTMDSDNTTLIRQIVLSFDTEGNPIGEESRTGFLYSVNVIPTNESNTYVLLFQGEDGTDTLKYITKPSKHIIERFIESRSDLEGVKLYRTIYFYNDLGRMEKIVNYDPVSLVDKNYVGIDWVPTDSVTYSYEANNVIFGNIEFQHKMTYDEEGRLLLIESENFIYDISEKTEYQWDIKGMLLLIEWEQEGVSEKTFVTYKYYE